MCLIKFFLTYYIIGTISSAFFEFLISKFSKIKSERINVNLRSVNWSDRFWYINLWPSFVTFFFYSMIKARKNVNKDFN